MPLTPEQQKKNQQNRRQAQKSGGQVFRGPNYQAPAAPAAPDVPAAPAQPATNPWANSPMSTGGGIWQTGGTPYGQANLFAGNDAATGKPYYFAGYKPDGSPAFSWSPTYNPAEFGDTMGLNRQAGHFQDATQGGGQFDASGAFVSNAQGSQYAFDPVAKALLQTGSYTGGAPPVPTGSTGGAGVNPNLTGGNGQGQGYSSTGGQAPPPPAPTQAPAVQTSQAQAPPPVRPGPNLGGMGGSAQAYNFGQVNQSGPFQGGASNQAVYGSGNQPSRVPWQMRLAGGGGAANDRPGQSASRLF